MKTLVIGASLKPERYSNIAIRKLRSNDIETVAFGLREGKVADVSIDTDLLSYKHIHTVTLYLNPKRQKEYYDYILSLKPKRIIFNPGTENPEFFKQATMAGIKAENACTLVMLNLDIYKEN